MPDAGKLEPTKAGAAGPTTLVLLCQDLESAAPGLALASLAQELASRLQGVQVRVEEGLCHRPAALKDALRQARVQRLVLGLCSDDYPAWEIQAHARKAGLDAFGVQVVDLGGAVAGASPPASRQVGTLLAAAIARARAFPGSRPENERVAFLGASQRVSRRALFTLPPFIYRPVPSVNRARCVAAEGCDLCVRACTPRALTADGGRISVDKDRCRDCGICVSACPQRAVEFPGWSPDELEAQVVSLLEAAAGGPENERPASALLFLCKDAPLPAGGWLPVRVPCVAMLPVAAMLQPLARGMGLVALARCPDACPEGQEALARGRVDYCQQLLRLLGDAPERVQMWDGQTAAAGPTRGPVPNPGQAPRGPVVLFGSAAAAQAVEELVARHALAGELRLEHPHSPLGLVEINAEACTGCGTCAGACPTGALAYRRTEAGVSLVFDARVCVGCGACVSRCSERAAHAIAVVRVTQWPLLSGGPRVLFQDQEVRCQRCGAPIAPSRLLSRIAAVLGSDYAAGAVTRLCLDCRGLSLAGQSMG